MTTPSTPGWYDDPDGSNAERRWDGQMWTPERRRKPIPPAPRPPVTPYPPQRPVQPAYDYPAMGPADYPVPPQPAWGPPDHPRGRLSPHEIFAIAIGLCGMTLLATAFMEWGRARAFSNLDGDPIVLKLSFPGVGDVRGGFNLSNTVGDRVGVEVNNIDALYNTNAGWPAILFGVLVMVTAVAYWRLKERIALAIAAAVLGSIATAIFAYQLIDLRRIFGDQPIRADAEFSPGPGLLGATVLAVAVVGLGIAALLIERRGQQRWIDS